MVIYFSIYLGMTIWLYRWCFSKSPTCRMIFWRRSVRFVFFCCHVADLRVRFFLRKRLRFAVAMWNYEKGTDTYPWFWTQTIFTGGIHVGWVIVMFLARLAIHFIESHNRNIKHLPDGIPKWLDQSFQMALHFWQKGWPTNIIQASPHSNQGKWPCKLLSMGLLIST